MKIRVTEVKEIFHPAEFIETYGTTPDEKFAYDLGQYQELKDEQDTILLWLFGLAMLIFLMYLIYHVISKIRGNEKNVQLNNYGIFLSLLGLVNYSIYFTDEGTYNLPPQDK